jgi:hypothetical protein
MGNIFERPSERMIPHYLYKEARTVLGSLPRAL